MMNRTGTIERGYCGIALYNPKTSFNIGTCLRNCMCFGADFISIIGPRYQKFKHQAGDTLKTWRHIPVYEHLTFEDFYTHIPHDCQLVSVEVDGENIKTYIHPQRVIYLFGPEDGTLPKLPGKRIKLDTRFCLNLAVTTGIILFDRQTKKGAQ